MTWKQSGKWCENNRMVNNMKKSHYFLSTEVPQCWNLRKFELQCNYQALLRKSETKLHFGRYGYMVWAHKIHQQQDQQNYKSPEIAVLIIYSFWICTNILLSIYILPPYLRKSAFTTIFLLILPPTLSAAEMCFEGCCRLPQVTLLSNQYRNTF